LKTAYLANNLLMENRDKVQIDPIVQVEGKFVYSVFRSKFEYCLLMENIGYTAKIKSLCLPFTDPRF